MRSLLRLLANLNPLTLASAGWRWARRLWDELRELRTHQHLRGGAREMVAAELQRNADIFAAGGPETVPPPEIYWMEAKKTLITTQWHRHSDDLTLLRKRHGDLWRELVAVYAILDSPAHHPPALSAAEIRALAMRLSEADL